MNEVNGFFKLILTPPKPNRTQQTKRTGLIHVGVYPAVAFMADRNPEPLVKIKWPRTATRMMDF